MRAAERVGPSVVSVYVARTEQIQPRSMLESFLLPPGAEREVTGMGSGFVIDAAGLIVTNEHVVRGATEVGVTLPDGRDVEARIVGVDDVHDLALLRVVPPDGETLRLPAAPLGDSDELMIGEWVVAIGNPLGFILATPGPTVTAGVVEPRYPTFKGIMDAKKKPMETKSLADVGAESSDGQTVASITDAPERSGGRKIEDEGEAFNEIIALLEERKVL